MSQHRPNAALIEGLKEYLVDDQYGIVRALKPEILAAGAPNFYQFSAYPCDTRALARRSCVPRVGGAATERKAAWTLALLRAVSVYSAAFYEPERLLLSSSAELDSAHVPPEDFALYEPEQYRLPGFPWLPFDRATPVRWAEVEEVLTGERLLVPAALVYVPYFPRQGTGEAPIIQPSITGLACDSSLTRAIRAAICEVIKEDALAVTWQSRRAPPQVRIETLSDANYERVARFERTGASVTLFSLESELGAPVLLAALSGTGAEQPCLICSGAASLDPEDAARQAVEGLAHAHFHYHRIHALYPSGPTISPDSVVTGTDHVLFWWNHENARHSRFLFSSRQRIEFEEIPNLSRGNESADLAVLAEELRRRDRRAVVARLSTTDASSLGLEVVRAIIPGCLPILAGTARQPHGGARVRRASGQSAPVQPADVSSGGDIPHPFAACGFYNE
jgi:ribosomal protein S12 methylthiotransferase accessory factor